MSAVPGWTEKGEQVEIGFGIIYNKNWKDIQVVELDGN